MDLRQMEVYLERLSQLKKEYDGQISILTGLETDFITGYEEETAAFLNTYGPSLDDGILSVHFLKTGPSYICLDFDEHAFQRLADRFGSVEAVYEQYYETVYSSIVTPLGPFKPKRVGHITLVKKFARLFPYSMSPQIRELAARCLDAVKEHGMELDVNTSGLRKKFAGEVYMEDWMAETAKQKNPAHIRVGRPSSGRCRQFLRNVQKHHYFISAASGRRNTLSIQIFTSSKYLL